jgi:hypothetical protein
MTGVGRREELQVGLVRDGDGGGERKELGNTQLLRGNIGIIGTFGY